MLYTYFALKICADGHNYEFCIQERFCGGRNKCGGNSPGTSEVLPIIVPNGYCFKTLSQELADYIYENVY